MARVWIDGFEGGNYSNWTVAAGTASIDATSKIDGVYCFKLYSGGSADAAYRSLPAASEYFFAFRINLNRTNGRGGFSFRYNTTPIVQFCLAADYKYAVYRGTTLIATGLTAMTSGMHLIEGHIIIHDTTGVVQLKIDGNPVLEVDFTGDTKPGADTQVNNILLGRGTVGYEPESYYDNIIIDTAAWIGDTHISAIVPTGVGDKAEWTPTAGENWGCVDEKPADDADYVSTNTNDLIDMHAASNLSGTIGTIKCVQIQARGLYVGSPTPTKIAPGLRSGGANYFGADQALTLSAVNCLWMQEVDPATSIAWTESGVNAIEIGYKSRA